MVFESESPRALRIAVLGAGPVGMEAAVYGRLLGHPVTLYEQGDLAQAVRTWRHVRMFSPWSMNQTVLGRQRLDLLGHRAPPPSAFPTGAELVEQYLLPLSRDPLLAGCVRLHSRVVEIGRSGVLKGDFRGAAGQGPRAQHPFRLLVESRTGEHVEHADVVIDSTGTYGCPNSIGDGGIPAPGERWLGGRLWRHLPDVLGADRTRFAGRKVLVVGGGLSAATAVTALAQLCRESPSTEVSWAVRRDAALPYGGVGEDEEPLPERARLRREANALAQAAREGREPRNLRCYLGTVVDELAAEGHRLRAVLRPRRGARVVDLFDEVIGLTGYGPDSSLYRELQVHECPATLGPMGLATAMEAAGPRGLFSEGARPAAELVALQEPRFYVVGAKSFGRRSGFLLPYGHAQVRALYAHLHGAAELDLYQAAAQGRRSEPTAASA